MTANTNPRPYKQGVRAQAQQRTREALLDAAIDEFYEGGWQKTSLEALAARAGVTKQTLLRHFGSKDGLLLQALLHGAAQVRDQRWSLPKGDLEGTVDNLLDHYEAWGERAMRIGTWQSGPDGFASFAQVGRQFHYDWVEYAFGPWLEHLGETARTRCRDTLIALCDVHTWWILSHDLELDRPELRATLINVIRRLIDQ